MFLLQQNVKVFAKLAKTKIKSFFVDEKGEVNIVATVVLIGIAVLLAVIFKDQIVKLMNQLFTTIFDNAGKAVTE